MQAVEAFIREFLQDQVEEAKREQAVRTEFRKKYYSKDCHWGSREGEVERCQSESVVGASCSGDTAEAITVFTSPERSNRSRTYRCRLRYHLKEAEGRWYIQSLDFECRYCKGEKGCTVCHFCQGEGWISSIRARRPLH